MTSRPPRRQQVIGALFQLLLLLAVLLGTGAADAEATEDRSARLGLGQATAIHLREAEPSVELWPAVRVLPDPQGSLDWRAALARLPDFRPPVGPTNNLGVQRKAVWLAVDLQVKDGDGQWVFDLDYPPFNELRLYVVSEGQLVQAVVLGSSLPYEARPLRSRTHAAKLQLAPGRTYQLLLLARTDTSMILPMSLSKQETYHEREAARLIIQGLMFGIAAAMFAYCVVHGISLRDRLFALYGVLMLSSAAFFIDFTGLGQQFLWSRREGMTAMLSPLSMLLAMAAGAPFAMRSLDTRRHSPGLHRALMLVSITGALLFVLGLCGLFSYRQAQVTASIIGPFAPLLVIPAAWRRARNGERIGLFLLLGWSIYVVGAMCVGGLLRGYIPANVWTLHLFQVTSLLEMLAWLRVLSLHTEHVRETAQRNAEALHSLSVLAQTDPLTGLPNRRGLDAALADALLNAGPERQVAVFMIDLDGFKAVNDRLGHAAGDQLLIEVSHRLVSELRRSDVVARLGGDEFVVLATGLREENEAQLIGRKLLDAFAEPVVVNDQPCRIGLTIGVALSPTDSTESAELLRRADAAMYAGKRAGRHCLQRSVDLVPA